MKYQKPDCQGGPDGLEALPDSRASDTDKFEELIMLKRFLVIALVVFASAMLAFAQNSNSSTTTTRTRTVEPKASPTPKATPKSTGTGTASQRPKASSTPVAPSTGVLSAFDKII